jgi:hypothetical protein
MKTWTIILTLLLGSTVFGQQNTFDLIDTTFEIAAIYTIPPLIYNICIRYGDTFEKDNEQTLDSLTIFFKKNPDLKIEIGCHTDQRGSTEYNLKLTDKQADNIKILLVDRGVNGNQINTKGYGETKPIIEQADIDNLKTNEEKEFAYQKNRRTELKILEIEK